MAKRALVAVGGNALIRQGQRGTMTEQRENAAITARCIVQLITQDYCVILTHGNGPQVGAELLQAELAAAEVSPEPLDVSVAQTQGAIGYVLAQALDAALAEARSRVPLVPVITQTIVDDHDPAFQQPTKPIGPFYSAEEAQRRVHEYGWSMVEDAARGYRRVVASPEPREIIEIEPIGNLVRAGDLVIAAGGGGIPVVRRDGRLIGVEAVIDKDLTSALLAHLLNVDAFIIATDTEYVYLNYKRPDQRALDWISASDAQMYFDAGHFPPGNMGPKITAALRFLHAGGREVIITSPERLLDAVLGNSGTHILPDDRPIPQEHIWRSL
jgi:carbamate kinase